MKPFKRSVLAASVLSIMLGLNGCFVQDLIGGAADNGSNSEQTQEGVAVQGKVKLAGVVQLAAQDVSFAASKVGQRRTFRKTVEAEDLKGTPAPGTLVLVSDATGNTVSAVSGSDAAFDLEVESGQMYAVIFIDTANMKVIGSLVQGGNTDEAAAIDLNNNTNLGNVVIDQVNGKAVAQVDVDPDSVVQEDGVIAKIVSALAMDKDGDGKISTDDLNNIQAGNLDSLTRISPLNFMGDRDTWVMQGRKYEYADQYGSGGGEERTFRITRDKLVNGPSGDKVEALKHAEATYYTDSHSTWIDPMTNQSQTWSTKGYYDSQIAADNKLMWDGDMSNDPVNRECDGDVNTTNDFWCDPYGNLTKLNPIDPELKFSFDSGVWAWARYQYADKAKGMILDGFWDFQNKKVSWPQGEGGIPMEIVLGEFTAMDDKGGAEGSADTAAGGPGMGGFTVDLIKDGSLEDTLGNKLPIMRVKMTMGDFVEGFYIVAKYGAEMPAFDVNGAEIPWQDAFKDSRFGIVSKKMASADADTKLATYCKDSTDAKVQSVGGGESVIICRTSPNKIGTHDTASAMPNGQAGGQEARNSWLAFLSNNLEQMDKVDFNDFSSGVDQSFIEEQNSQAFMWLDWSEAGNVEPKAWDWATGVRLTVLDDGTSQNFVTTRTPDDVVGGETAADANIHFSGTGITFKMELTQWDHSAQKPIILGESVESQVFNTNGAELLESIAGTIAIPTLTPGSTVYADYWEDWVWDSATNTETRYCAAPAGLELVMYQDDGTGKKEVWREFLEGYDVRGKQLAEGESCFKN